MLAATVPELFSDDAGAQRAVKFSVPHLTDHDLRQMDEAWLTNLPEAKARAVLLRVVADLKESRDRLNPHSGSSSRPAGVRGGP